MKLAKAIVIKNQFINKNNTSGGATPARFVENYMARNDATLTVYPVKNGMKRQNSTDSVSIYQIQRDQLLKNKESFNAKQPTKDNWFDLTTLEGRSFDGQSLSLGKNELQKQAGKIQKAFDQGHTVMKLVFSYNNQYLENKGVEKPHSTNLNFHQNVDEMKLRIATQKGCDALTKSLAYRQPLYLGSIQLDRDHPHAHIVVCETAKPKISTAKHFYDGTEYGRLTKHNRQAVRRAIDSTLTLTKNLAFMPSNSLENARLANENYSQKFANLPQEKAVVLLTSRDHDLVSEKIANGLYHSLAKRTNQTPQEIKHKLADKLTAKNSMPKKTSLPPLLTLQLLAMQKRKQKNKYAKMVAKLERAKQLKNREKERQRKLADNYDKLKKLAKNQPLLAPFIEQGLKPFYQTAIGNTSLRIDLARKNTFQPVRNIPRPVKDDYQMLHEMQKQARQPFEKDAVNNSLNRYTISWHQKAWINAKDVIKHLADHHFLPKPRRYANLSVKELPNKTDQANMRVQEKVLAKNALDVADALPDNKLKRDVQTDLKEALNYQTPHNQPLASAIASAKIKKSLNYQQANQLLVKNLN